MLNVTLNAWQVDAELARLSWEILDVFGDGIARVEYRLRKEGSDGVWLDSGGSTGEAVLAVANYRGTLTFDLKVTDFSDREVAVSSQVAVDNFIPPSPPDWLRYEAESPLSTTFEWGAASVSPTVRSWRLVSVDAENNATVLAETPSYQRSVSVAASTRQLNRVVVYGVDEFGNTSEQSPVLTFSRTSNGPTIVLDAWRLNAMEAALSWVIAAQGFLSDVRWTLTASDRLLSDAGLPVDEVRIDVRDYMGPITLQVTATDDQGRVSTVSSTANVWNKAPGRVAIATELVGIRFIRVKVTPPTDAALSHVLLYGPSGAVELRAPYIHTFEGLTPQTPYNLSVRAVNPGGVSGETTFLMEVTTLADPLAPPPPSPQPVGIELLPPLLNLLVGDTRGYLLQLYTDTRVRDPKATQVVHPPVALDAVLDYFLPMAPQFGDILRKETVDSESYQASELIDRTGDPLEKLAILCERLEFGAIWNLG